MKLKGKKRAIAAAAIAAMKRKGTLWGRDSSGKRRKGVRSAGKEKAKNKIVGREEYMKRASAGKERANNLQKQRDAFHLDNNSPTMSIKPVKGLGKAKKIFRKNATFKAGDFVSTLTIDTSGKEGRRIAQIDRKAKKSRFVIFKKEKAVDKNRMNAALKFGGMIDQSKHAHKKVDGILTS